MSMIDSATLTTIDSILKDDYRDPIVELLNNKNVLSSRIERTTEFTSGKRAFFPLHIGRNEGIGARGEYDGTADTQLPIPGAQEYDEAVYGMTYQYGRAQFTGPGIAAAREKEGGFARLVDSEMKGLVRDTARDQNRQMFCGKHGGLGVVTAVTNAATGKLIFGGGSQHFSKSRRCAIHDATGSAWTKLNGTNGRLIVSAVNSSTNEVTFVDEDGSTVNLSDKSFCSEIPAVGDIVTRYDSYGMEMFGLIDLVSNDNPLYLKSTFGTMKKYVGGIDRTSESWWQANVTAWGAKFGEQIFQDMIDTVDVEGDGEISIFLTTHALFNAYGNFLTPDRRFQSTGTKFEMLDGAFASLEYNGIPVVKDRDCQAGYIWGLDEETLALLMMADWDWMDKDGAILSRVANADAYNATLFSYREMAINDPKNNVVYTGITT
jgi:hypothetical protein